MLVRLDKLNATKLNTDKLILIKDLTLIGICLAQLH